MTYTILFLEKECVTRMTSWHAGLDAAKRYACDQLASRRGERAEVWDAADKVVFAFSEEAANVEREDLILRGLSVRAR